MSSPWGDNRSFVTGQNLQIKCQLAMTSMQAGQNPFISLYTNIYTPQVHKTIAARIWVVFYTSINVGIDGNFNLETTHVTRGVDTEKTWRLVHKNCHSRLQIKDLLLSLNPPGLNL